MMTRIRKINDSLPGLLLGEIIFCILAGTVIFIFFDNKFYNSLGLLAGLAVAVFWAINMSMGLNDAVDRDESEAVKKMQRGTAVRYGIALIVLGILVLTGIGNPITAFVGMIGLKLAAYATPITDKIFRR